MTLTVEIRLKDAQDAYRLINLARELVPRPEPDPAAPLVTNPVYRVPRSRAQELRAQADELERAQTLRAEFWKLSDAFGEFRVIP